jgi:hypothetical protein
MKYFSLSIGYKTVRVSGHRSEQERGAAALSEGSLSSVGLYRRAPWHGPERRWDKTARYVN